MEDRAFKLTDRYGTLLAKLLPAIFFSSDKKRDTVSGNGDEWHLDAWIVRKTMDGRKPYKHALAFK
jgi:predicted nuclease of restriction endonuclease-like RecB superfamily